MDWKCRESEYKKPEYNDRMSNEAIQKSLMKNASHKMGKWKKTARIKRLLQILSSPLEMVYLPPATIFLQPLFCLGVHVSISIYEISMSHRDQGYV
jgi:hypothetical protein